MQRNGYARRTTTRRVRGGFEPLEDRLCLSVTVTSSPDSGGRELKIVGDEGVNNISIVDQGTGHVDVFNGAGKMLGAADNDHSTRVVAKKSTVKKAAKPR